MDIVILGSSIFCLEIFELIDIINDAYGTNHRIISILDDNVERHGLSVYGVEIAGSLDRVEDYPNANFVLTIGSPKKMFARRQTIERLGVERERFPTLIHPRAVVHESASIGHGCLIYQDVLIQPQVHLGDFTTFFVASQVYRATAIGEFSIITNRVNILSMVNIGKETYIATGVSVDNGVTIGDRSVIGMGAVIVRDIPPDSYVLSSARMEFRERNF